jgi:Predicted permeases
VFVADSRNDHSQDSGTPSEIAQQAAASRRSDQDSVGGLAQQGAGQRVIVAERGNITLQRPSKAIWMNLTGAETHVWNPSNPDKYDRTDSATQRILLPTRSSGSTFEVNTVARSFREMNLTELMNQERQLARSSRYADRFNRNVALVEIHKKFSIPFACITFGVLGLPLGITNRRGGKSSGFSLSIAIIVAYYLMITNGEELASSGEIAPWFGMWAPNILFLGLGVYLLSRANRDAVAQRREGGIVVRAFRWLGALLETRSRKAMARPLSSDGTVLNRLDITFPNIIDRYILREFLKLLGLVLVSVTALFVIVEYTEMARDVRQNQVAASTLLRYFRFQIFMLLNWSLPVSVLVTTLVTFGIMAKNNEITAIKSGGVSLYRVAAPILAVAVVICIVAYLLLDFVLPYANERVYEIRRRIEGRPAVTATAQQKLWYLGKGRYLINFLAYDPSVKRLTQVQVFEFHPSQFRLTRRVYADRATWNGQAWAFEYGWIRSFTDDGGSTFTRITEPLALFYPETPEDFDTKITPPDQMTYAQLRRYIGTLRESGYAADELAVRLYQKTSWPALSLVMVLIAMPFAFKIGKRGALYGIGLALVLGIVYWLVFAIFAKFGEVGNLPPLLAAWSANVLFALAAAYMFLHVDT